MKAISKKDKQKAKRTKKKKNELESSDEELDKVQVKDKQKAKATDINKQRNGLQRNGLREDNPKINESTTKSDKESSMVDEIVSTIELGNEYTKSSEHASIVESIEEVHEAEHKSTQESTQELEIEKSTDELSSTQVKLKNSKRASHSKEISNGVVTTQKSKPNTKSTTNVSPVTPTKNTHAVRDTWVKGIVEKFLNTPPVQVPTRNRNVSTLKYNAKEVSTKLKQKKEATKGTRVKKCLTKQVNTLTQIYSPSGRNKKNNVKTLKKKII